VDANVVFALPILVLAFAAYKVIFAAPTKPRSKDYSFGNDRPSRGDKNRFKAVSIISHGERCPESQALKGERFLPNEAPAIPLQDCSVEQCNCRYSRHVDRRSGEGRRRTISPAGDGARELNPDKQSRRKNGGQRPNDSN
jgi:hypothetical protein